VRYNSNSLKDDEKLSGEPDLDIPYDECVHYVSSIRVQMQKLQIVSNFGLLKKFIQFQYDAKGSLSQITNEYLAHLTNYKKHVKKEKDAKTETTQASFATILEARENKEMSDRSKKSTFEVLRN
jgi:hypothetical protein